MPPLSSKKIPRVAKKVLKDGAAALERAASSCVDRKFLHAADMILKTEGRLVITGMGKAGFIAQKVSATFASTGTPSLFVHPADALHGDLGRIAPADLLLMFSYSGETEEVVRLLGPVKRLGAKIIGVTAESKSTLGREADAVIEMGKYVESGHGLAPTTSTTVMLGIGDALAMSVASARGFTEEEFHLNHPAGALGKKLMRVEQVMRKGEMVPVVSMKKKLAEVISVMTKTPGRPGAAIVVDQKGLLLGLFTDGDLRRLVETETLDTSQPVTEVMSKGPKSVTPDQFVSDAAQLLRRHRVDQVPVVDRKRRPVGLLDVQDLLAMRFL